MTNQTPNAVEARDILALLGTLMLFAGLWLWLHLGAALVVVGALFITVSTRGLAAARRARQ